jgi:hypothetical protein
MTKEPIVIINAVGALLIAVLPLLAVLGLTNLSVEQFGGIEAFVVAVVAIAATLFSRSKVSPVV